MRHYVIGKTGAFAVENSIRWLRNGCCATPGARFTDVIIIRPQLEVDVQPVAPTVGAAIAWAKIDTAQKVGPIARGPRELWSDSAAPDKLVVGEGGMLAAWEFVIIFIRVEQRRDSDLAHIAEAFCGARCLLCFTQRRQKQRRQQGDDGDRYEKFDQRECRVSGRRAR